MNVREEVIAQFMQAAQDHGRQLAPLHDELALLESGLDSIGFAIVVARLERALGVDPFSEDDFGSLPMTLGGFIRCYENAAQLSVSS